ncbi:MAG: transporter ATP-binding protein [Noviherbaspirillum sp.]|jgi:NitT/TauT family transport system ATP-binding protein|nr:transporter ATP-binding protein [Noviherbaspirillum sp.]MDB5794007.1 transporter ATP-binding protein [Noviherbaspirillum sp.]
MSSQQTMNRPDDEFIQIKSISKHFGTGSARRNILNNVQGSIAKGSFVSLLGASGCGKSTLLQIVAGLQGADGGEIVLRNKVITEPPFEMLYLFQQYTKSIFPWRTVSENIAFGMESRGKWSRKEINERCQNMIKQVGLAGYGDYYPRQLSGGMQQRVAIARALACEPDVLLMDEPFSAVDAMTRASLQDLVLELWEKLGLTILFVTHDIEEAVYLSNRVIVLHRSPLNLALDMEIDLPYPRNHLTTPEQPGFLKYRHRLYEEIYKAERGEK